MKKTDNPWLGLQAYRETDTLYGRNDDIRRLSQQIFDNVDTVLYGKSGIGKSSIINAGILRKARQNDIIPIYIRLDHKSCVETSYVQQIRIAIQAEGVEIHNIHPESDNDFLWELFHCNEFLKDGERVKLLIIFDQFEEIFTLQHTAAFKRSFFDNIADVLNNVKPKELTRVTEQIDTNTTIVSSNTIEEKSLQKPKLSDLIAQINKKSQKYVTDNEVHFVFTLREDFLSEFEYYSYSIPSLRQHRYALRPINEEQAADIIQLPREGLISPEVAELIIEKVSGRKDIKIDGIPEIEIDSAILSLYLNRLYEQMEGDVITAELVESRSDSIIADFYASCIEGIPDHVVEYLEYHLINEEGRRDNKNLNAIYKRAGREYVDTLIENKLLRKFVYADGYRVEYIHDILCPIVVKHRAERQERIEKELQNKKLKNLKKQRGFTVLGILILLVVFFSYYLAFHYPIVDRFANTTKEWGCFVGIEPLSEKDASYRTYHFVLKKRGLLTKTYSSMECRDRFGNLYSGHSLSPYLMSSSFDDSILVDGIKDKLKIACKWEFVKDPINDSLVIQEQVYDQYDNLLYAFNYSTPQKRKSENNDVKKERNDNANLRTNKNEKLKMVKIGSYVDEQGLPLEILKSGYRFVRITFDNNGHDMLVEYFDWEGNPSTNSDNAYQTYYEYDDLGQCISISSLNIYGKRMIDNAGNCGMVNKYDGYRLVESLSVDEFGREKTTNSGYSRVEYKYDEHGRETEITVWNKDKPSDENTLNFHKLEISYDDKANTNIQVFYNSNEEQIVLNKGKYDAKGNLLYYEEITDEKKAIGNNQFDEDNILICQKEIILEGEDTIGVYNYEKSSNTITRVYKGKIYTEYINIKRYDEKDRIIEDVYYELDGKTPYEDNYIWHKVSHTYTDNGYDKESIFYEDNDSVVYYNRDKVDKILVYKRFPNRNYIEKTEYNSDTTLLKQNLDMYGNVIEETRGFKKIYYLVNAKATHHNGCVVGWLSRYKFPLGNLMLYHEAENSYIPCDENGNTNISASYVLPEIYGSNWEWDKLAVFIECVDDGRTWHGVILASSSGICYGDEEYVPTNFNGTDLLYCLNLTTMRVVKLIPDNLDYWTMYLHPTTKLENDLYIDFFQKLE